MVASNQCKAKLRNITHSVLQAAAMSHRIADLHLSVHRDVVVTATCHMLLRLAHMEGLDGAGNAMWVLLEVLQAVSKPDRALA